MTLAIQLLDAVTPEVLLEGWNFCTDDEVLFVPDDLDADRIAIDDEVYLSVREATRHRGDLDLVVRAGYLWDKVGKTDAFTSNVYLDVIYNLPFDECIRPARAYIAARAARLFEALVNGDRSAEQAASGMEMRARITLCSIDDSSAEHSFIRNTPTAGRPRPLNRLSP